MSENNKVDYLKEKLKQALTSTFKVISDDFNITDKIERNKKSDKYDFYEFQNLKNKNDFIKARADSDSSALKRKFSNKDIFEKNLPSNISCKSLYSIAEKIRCESLGGKMLRGIKKNYVDNYNLKISLKKKEKFKTKDDVAINEAFELYMLNKFHNIELNSLTKEMLNFWEKDFERSISKHIKFLKDNLEDQYKYSSKFSEIFQEMEISQNEENEEIKEENNNDGQNTPSDNDSDSNSMDDKDQNKEDEIQASLDSDYEISDYKLDDQLTDTDLDKDSAEKVMQKKSLNYPDIEYNVFTKDYDEITKAEI